MIRPLYDWTMRLAGHRRANWALAAISFIESSFFPIPPDVMLMPMVLANRRQAWRIATICTIASVLGGFAGYAIGFFLFETVGQAIIDLYGAAEKFESFQAGYNEHGAWAVFIFALTFFPYKVITITSGVTALSLGAFFAASVIGRGLRFFVVAGLLWKYGEPIQGFIEKRLNLLFVVFVVLLVGGFAALKLL